MIRLADETAAAAAMAATNPSGEFRVLLSPSIWDMSAHEIRNTSCDPVVASAGGVDREGLDAALEVRGCDGRPTARRVATLLAPASPAVTLPIDHRRR
jgi:hypothetical protein